jgi:HEAT repeat protein
VRRRLRIAIIVLLVAVVGGLAWQMTRPREPVTRPREPVYNGKSLTAWLKEYRDAKDSMNSNGNEAEIAIRAIGTNSIPRLIGMMTAKPSNLNVSDLTDRQQLGAVGLVALGDQGRSAIPAMVDCLNYTNYTDPLVRSFALYVLGSLGPTAQDAVPSIVQALHDPSTNVQPSAAWALCAIHQNAGQAIPALVQSLRSGDAPVRWTIIQSLPLFKAEAKRAVPALIELLNDSDEAMRFAATNTLRAIDPEAAAKAGIK